MTDDVTGGVLRIADDLRLTRMGFGAMRLAGPGVWGPPADRDEALAVLRTVVELGLNHVDTSDYYGPYTVNEVIREALHPYPQGFQLVTKVGALREADRSWRIAMSRDDLVRAVHDNLDHLGLSTVDIVNLRLVDDRDIAEPFTVLADLRREGLIRHLGLSNVSVDQVVAARRIAPVVCVQNLYNVAIRHDDPLVDWCAAEGIAYVPYFPLGGFTPLQSDVLDEVARDLGATPMQVALAWLLHRSPTIVLIPGTSSVAHLRENAAAATLALPADAMARLDAIGA